MQQVELILLTKVPEEVPCLSQRIGRRADRAKMRRIAHGPDRLLRPKRNVKADRERNCGQFGFLEAQRKNSGVEFD
jgi:hypothetical protein